MRIVYFNSINAADRDFARNAKTADPSVRAIDVASTRSFCDVPGCEPGELRHAVRSIPILLDDAAEARTKAEYDAPIVFEPLFRVVVP